MKDRKTRKSRSEEKVVGFSSAFLFPARKQESHPEWNQGDKPPDAEENPGSGIVKSWEDKQDRGRIPDTFT